jgi:hypothetical protein
MFVVLATFINRDIGLPIKNCHLGRGIRFPGSAVSE